MQCEFGWHHQLDVYATVGAASLFSVVRGDEAFCAVGGLECLARNTLGDEGEHYAGRAIWRVLDSVLRVAVLKVAVPVLVALVVIRVGVKVLQAAFAHAAWARLVEHTLSWLAWLAMVLWVSGLLPVVLNELEQITWKVGASTLSVRTLLEGLLTASAVLILTLWVSAAIETRLLRSATGGELSLRKAVSNATRALLMFVGVMLALSSVGIDLTALSVLGGAVGVGIGFGLQKLAANYISGFVILAERHQRSLDRLQQGSRCCQRRNRDL